MLPSSGELSHVGKLHTGCVCSALPITLTCFVVHSERTACTCPIHSKSIPCGNTVRALYTSRAQGGADKTVHEQPIFGPLSRAAWHDDLDVSASPEREPGQRNSFPLSNTNRITLVSVHIADNRLHQCAHCTGEGQ